MIVIDGQSYNIGIVSLKRKAEFLDSYAQRNERGDLNRKLIGVYYNYELQLSSSQNHPDYAALWDKLTEPVEFHEVTIPGENYTFTAYMSGVSDELKRIYYNGKDTRLYWHNLTVNFIAKSPSRKG